MAVQHHFSPYASNGGTVLAISGEDYAIIASDTRLSEGYSIHCRDSPKIYQLTEQCALGVAGFHGDILTFVKRLRVRIKVYHQTHGIVMSPPAIAQMLSTMLYSARFFPFYINCLLGGVTADGKGCVYSYDPVGSYEREVYRSAGTANALLQPLLDNQIGKKNMEGVQQVPIPKDEAVKLVKDVFTSAGERDIYTGDSVAITIVTPQGIETERFALRKD